MDGRQRTVMTCVHRLQHVERLFPTHLANDDAIRPHTQGIDKQLSLSDGALPFDVRWPGLQSSDMLLMKLQLGRILDGNDALALSNEAREHVEQRRLPRSCTSADECVEPRPDAVSEKVQHW